MTRRTALGCGTALLLAVSTTFAFQAKTPDLTGTWTGTFTSISTTGQPDEDPAHLVLKQNGTELTGTGGPVESRQTPIAKGKVATVKEVTTATFEVTEGSAIIRFELRLVEGRLKGSAVADVDGRTRTATVDVGRTR